MTKILGIIPARGGSKGIPGKNIRLLGGKPLIYYAAHAARESGLVDRLILTTDSAEIAAVGKGLGIETPFIRPPQLARDDTPMFPVIDHALQFIEREGWKPEIILLLQPTAPLRKPEHLQAAARILSETNCDSVVSVVEVPQHYAPDFVLKLEEGKLRPFLEGGERVTRRQDVRAAYSRDGTVYAFRRDVLIHKLNIYGDDCRPLIIPRDRSCNLDTMEDWDEVEQKIAEQIQERS
ncbi:MAG: acylneuraminate cytidylyltransferase family protein [Anaerolineales bacterium]|nr:acylneuraminate cytidylyltransferase family protein [Anaerolineales bacterium]